MRLSRRMGLLHSGLSDLTNTTWTFNSELSLPTSDVGYVLNFTYTPTPVQDEPDQGIGILFTTSQGDYYMKFMDTQQYLYIAYAIDYLGRHEWGIYSHTITITGGTDATNSELIAWLQANATQVT